MRTRHDRLERVCQGDGWEHSGRLRCLDFDWSILSNDSQLVEYITYLYEPCVVGSPGPASHVFIVRRHTNSESAPISVYRDGRAILRRAPEDLAVAQLAWEVNRGVVEKAGNRLLLHAAAAERDGRVVILAGPEGSGKSTLVAALVRSGLRYVTDETVAVELRRRNDCSVSQADRAPRDGTLPAARPGAGDSSRCGRDIRWQRPPPGAPSRLSTWAWAGSAIDLTRRGGRCPRRAGVQLPQSGRRTFGRDRRRRERV